MNYLNDLAITMMPDLIVSWSFLAPTLNAASVLLLKAELCRKQERFDDMRILLRQVQKTAKAPSMKYLNDLTVSMFPGIMLS